MKSNKGFTLIELLAVIVILAIIALIATPLILNVINDAKEGAAQSSAYSYISAVETEIAQKMLTDATYNVPTVYTDINARVKGEKPSAVDLSLSDGVITSGTITISGYTATIVDGKIDKMESATTTGD